MSRAFEDASWDDAIAVVVLTGSGDRAFCTGADLDEQAAFLRKPRDYWKWMGAFIEAQDRLRNIGKPTIARLNGLVVGGGNEFNLACDLAVAADDVIIRHVGPVRGSVPAAGATQWLPLVVGDRRGGGGSLGEAPGRCRGDSRASRRRRQHRVRLGAPDPNLPVMRGAAPARAVYPLRQVRESALATHARIWGRHPPCTRHLRGFAFSNSQPRRRTR